MSFDVGIVVAVFGDLDRWRPLAARALESARAQNPAQIEYVEGRSLHEARNEGLGRLRTDWVVHLDADDELEPGYLDAMARSAADLRAPAVRYVRGRHPGHATMLRVSGHLDHPCTADCLTEGNWIVVGAAARTELVRAVGGWRDYPWSEDWDLWVRCWKAGATIEPVPAAVYRAHVRHDSRNRAPERAFKLAAHQAIARANGLPVPA